MVILVDDAKHWQYWKRVGSEFVAINIDLFWLGWSVTTLFVDNSVLCQHWFFECWVLDPPSHSRIVHARELILTPAFHWPNINTFSKASIQSISLIHLHRLLTLEPGISLWGLPWAKTWNLHLCVWAFFNDIFKAQQYYAYRRSHQELKTFCFNLSSLSFISKWAQSWQIRMFTRVMASLLSSDQHVTIVSLLK